MKVHFLILLVIPLVFGCEVNKTEILSERFELVNATLEASIFTSKKYNNELFQKLRADDQIKLKPVQEHAKGINQYLDKLKTVLVEKSGGWDPETGMLVSASDFELPYDFIRNSVYRKSFKDTVNSISTVISKSGNFEVPSIAFDGKDDPYWSLIPSQPAKTILELLFENVNLPGALSSISQLQQRVLEYERLAYQTVLLQELDSLRALSQ